MLLLPQIAVLLERHVVGLATKNRRSALAANWWYLRGLAAGGSRPRTMSSSSTPSPKGRVAIAQMLSTNDKPANMAIVRDLAAQAKQSQAALLLLPECCDFVAENRQQTLNLAEPLDGPAMQQYRQLATEFGLWLSLGGVHELIRPQRGAGEEETPSSKIYNSHVIIDATGSIVQVYRKLHLFDVDTPEMRFRESDVVQPGPQLVPPVDTPIGRVGLQICYDLRFAEPSLLLRKWGAQVLTYPSAFAFTTGQAHWEVLLRARAIETQCYVLAAAQLGWHNAKRRSWGHALAVDPWGTVLADCGGDENQNNNNTVATVDVDLAKVQPVRSSMPVFEHRRDDRYSLTSYDGGPGCTAAPPSDRQFGPNTIHKETIFYETQLCYAFTNLRCVVEGHVLVSTKRPMPRLSGLTAAEIADLFTTTCKVQRLLEAYYKTSSATVTVQDGPNAGQTVPHVHFHVMPRRPGDFKVNDQIYIKLDDRCLDKPDRSMEERIAEARIYRDFMAAQQANKATM